MSLDSLPCNSSAEEVAVYHTVSYLREQARSPVGIAIRGLGIPSEHTKRQWWSETKSAWIIEQVMIITIDCDTSVSGPRLSDEVARLKQTIFQFYEKSGAPQEEIRVAVFGNVLSKKGEQYGR